ncbi:AAA family ATPase [Actinoplanes sp. NPDC049118]|uniref:AAA family ATPase n=1 Tax=Actinoplanes sp. NPDC049118 TaxID=3155769 RepID=UPI0033F4DD9F
MTAAHRGWAPETTGTINRLDAVRNRLASRYVGRDLPVRLLQLGLVCREHVLLLGDPGTAKTDLVLRFADLINAEKFAYMLTRFTEPSEIFGSLDMAAFRASTYRVRTTGMLPRAQVAFLDEIFHGSSAILNSLLTLINERTFHNGSDPVAARLLTLIGAANEPPEDPVLRAFADRLLLRVELQPIAADHLGELLDRGWSQELERLRETPPAANEERATTRREEPILDVEEVVRLSRVLRDVDLTGVRDHYEDVIRELLAANVTLSDRRVVRGLKLVAGAALLRGAERAQLADFWPLMHFWTDPADVPVFTEVVQGRVQADGGDPLERVEEVATLLFRADNAFRQTLARLNGAQTSPHVLEGGLTELHRIRLYLHRFHPGEADADGRINQMISNLLNRADANVA